MQPGHPGQDPYGQQPAPGQPYGQPPYGQQPDPYAPPQAPWAQQPYDPYAVAKQHYGQQPPYGQPSYPDPYGQQPYGLPIYPNAGYPQQGDNTLGLVSMILGIASIPLVCCYLGIPLGIAGLVTGGLARQKATRGLATNPGQALTGLICGGVGLLLGILHIGLLALGLALPNS
ncbi:hypothetical protein [Micromonospora sp. CPCC 205556]|uniref:hypothetical protein n=1 Tax=Micromonospora sp. CPCC 205556 TaxID=3122398 RepID=UPI002FF0BCDB